MRCHASVPKTRMGVAVFFFAWCHALRAEVPVSRTANCSRGESGSFAEA